MFNRIFCVFLMAVFVSSSAPVAAAVKITKASSVSSTASDTNSVVGTVSSLLPTVLGLASSVKSLSAAQDEISADCIPTKTEIAFIDKMVKEWAKAGGVLPSGYDRKKCANGQGYAASVKNSAAVKGLEDSVCYDFFDEDGKIWDEYPKVGTGFYCKNGDIYCSSTSKEAVSVTNAYELFGLVDFGPDDYLASEITMASQLQEKTYNCQPSRINSKKRELWGNLLTDTVGTLGQPTNTGSIMEQVGSLGGGGNTFNSIGSIATQFLTK